MSSDTPRRRFPIVEVVLVLVACGVFVESRYRRTTPIGQLQELAADRRHGEVVERVNAYLEEGVDLSRAGAILVESYLATEEYHALGELLCEEKIPADDAATLDRVAMYLQTGNRAMKATGICLMEKAVALEPGSVRYNYDLGLLCWNGGRTHRARLQCEKVLTLDPGNVQALQILERIAKARHAASLDQDRFSQRTVRLKISCPPGITPHMAGSWDPVGGHHVSLGGFDPEPMTPGEPSTTPGQRVHRASKRLVTDSEHWYQVVVRSGPDPDDTVLAFCRFPVYPLSVEAVEINLDDHRVWNPEGILRPRPAPARPDGEGPDGSIYLLCVDSATFNVLIPLVQAGWMPNVRKLMREGVSMTLISRPPVSTVAFDILNFGTLRGLGLADVIAGGIGILKERGVNLLSYGDIQGEAHTWKHLADQGISTLYASWAEQLHYDAGGIETVLSHSVDPDAVAVAGQVPSDAIEKVRPFLQPGGRSLEGLNHSDELVASLYDQGVTKFYQGLELFERHRPRVSLVHVGFIDVSFHMFWDSMDSELSFLEPDREVDRRYQRVIAGLHGLLDLMVADLIEALDLERDTLVIFSDHGAVGGFAKSYYGHVPEGILIVAGAGVKRRLILSSKADMVDLVPTVCHLLGTRPPEGYPGRVLTEILTP